MCTPPFVRAVCLGALLLFVPTAGSGQGLLPAVAGAGAGLVLGGTVTAGALTARAHLTGQGLNDYADLVPLPALLAATGMLSGIVLGTTDAPALGRATVGALLLGAGGAGMGILVGRQFLDEETGPWAGALMGGAAGALTGWILGATLGSDGDAGRGPTFALRIPVGPWTPAP